jgi:transposase-like protein
MTKPKDLQSGKPKRRFTAEFKADVVGLVLDHGRRPSDVMKELGIPHSTLNLWLKQARGARAAGTGEVTADERKRLRELEKENAQLKMERDILKKAAAFFAKDHV